MKYCPECGAEMVVDKREPIYDKETGKITMYRRELHCPNVRFARLTGGSLKHWGTYSDFEQEQRV